MSKPDYVTFMNGVMNSPNDGTCKSCYGKGYEAVMCCSGMSDGVPDCGCRGLPVDFEKCSQGCPQIPDEKIIEYAMQKKKV